LFDKEFDHMILITNPEQNFNLTRLPLEQQGSAVFGGNPHRAKA
jgi:hypothetical protein